MTNRRRPWKVFVNRHQLRSSFASRERALDEAESAAADTNANCYVVDMTNGEVNEVWEVTPHDLHPRKLEELPF